MVSKMMPIFSGLMHFFNFYMVSSLMVKSLSEFARYSNKNSEGVDYLNKFNSPDKYALVTGASRGLGLAAVKALLGRGYHVILLSRSRTHAMEAIKKLYINNNAVFDDSKVSHWEIDVADFSSLSNFKLNYLPNICTLDVVVNNAGICLEGCDENILKQTLATNFYGAVGIIESCLPYMNECGAILNISSGDGELSYLNSDLASIIRNAETVQDVMDIPLALERMVYESVELAYGSTPCYSISKALLNVLTRCISQDTSTPIFAVCPGDVRTQMSSSDELERPGILDPAQAAYHIALMAANPDLFVPGKFYRFGKIIPW